MSHHKVIKDPKLLNFIATAKKSGHQNERLLKCWYRSQRRLDRSFYGNWDLLGRFEKDQLLH